MNSTMENEAPVIEPYVDERPKHRQTGGNSVAEKKELLERVVGL